MQLKIKIDLINLKKSPDLRVSLRAETIAEYADRYRDKLPMPPILVFKQRDFYLLADGRHRLQGMIEAGMTTCEAEVRIGDEKMCWEAAVKANATHGIPWNKTEKQNIIEDAVRRYPNKSHRDIAIMIGVSHTYVNRICTKPESGNTVSTKSENASKSESITPVVSQNKTVDNTNGTTPAAPPKPEVVTDIMGYPIPAKVLPYFKRMDEIKKWINELHAIHRNIMIFADLRDVLWIGVNFQDVDVYTHNLVTALRRALPEVVCVQCQGHPEINPDNKCPRCHGKGLISKFDYDLPTVSDAMRKLREKAIDAITEKHKQQKGTVYAETRQGV